MRLSINQEGLALVQLEATTAEVVVGKEGEIVSGGDMYTEVGAQAPAAKGSVMTSWIFILGISAATLAIGIVLGILLAKKRIKKGFDLYED